MTTFVLERWKGRSYNDSDVGYDDEWYEDINTVIITQPTKKHENTHIQQTQSNV